MREIATVQDILLPIRFYPSPFLKGTRRIPGRPARVAKFIGHTRIANRLLPLTEFSAHLLEHASASWIGGQVVNLVGIFMHVIEFFGRLARLHEGIVIFEPCTRTAWYTHTAG